MSTKARLLHYFPPPAAALEAAAEERPDSAMAIDDDWCATHKDLGALTGLTCQMFVDEAAHSPQPQADGSMPLLQELEKHPDPLAGLWIQDRAGRRTQVHIPPDCLAFQTGEALELITRGAFQAVPHFVRGMCALSFPRLVFNPSLEVGIVTLITRCRCTTREGWPHRSQHSLSSRSRICGRWWTRRGTLQRWASLLFRRICSYPRAD